MEKVGEDEESHELVDDVLLWRNLIQYIHKDIKYLAQVLKDHIRQEHLNAWINWTWHQMAESITCVIIFHEAQELDSVGFCLEHFFGCLHIF